MKRPIVYLTLLLALAWSARGAEPTLDIYWVDVEGGGGTLIVTPAKQSILIDTGWAEAPSAARIHEAAIEAGLTKIDYLIITHFHPDHFGGAAALARLMPIINVFDNGVPDHSPDMVFNDADFASAIQPYRTFPAEHRNLVRAGQGLPLWQMTGTADLSLRFLAAAGQFAPPPAGAPTNPLCSAPADPRDGVDTSENRNSVVSLLQFGPFKFYDGGDLTRRLERMLVCPVNLPGAVDVYQVDHHGLDVSSNPLLLESLAPTVTVMNNAAFKGGSPVTLATLRATKSIQGMYQVHRDMRGGEAFNTSSNYIANQTDHCQGNFIKCSVAASGKSYTISIPATGWSQTYQTKAAGK